MDIEAVTPAIRLIDLAPPIPGLERFIGAWLVCGQRKAIVDPGPTSAVPNLLSALSQLDISPQEIDYIILTHIHLDHAGGTGTALRDMPRARVFAHVQAYRHLADPARLWEASVKTLGDLARQYGRMEPVPEDRLAVMTDLAAVDLGRSVVLEAHYTPGHAAHHLSLLERGSGTLLAGEAAGVCINGAVRLATPPPFRLDETLSSIDRLIALQPGAICYGHFGAYGDAMDRLRLARSKLLAWHDIVGGAVREGLGPEETLALLRKRDRDLDYLDGLGPDACRRERDLLINTIKGLGRGG